MKKVSILNPFFLDLSSIYYVRYFFYLSFPQSLFVSVTRRCLCLGRRGAGGLGLRALTACNKPSSISNPEATLAGHNQPGQATRTKAPPIYIGARRALLHLSILSQNRQSLEYSFSLKIHIVLHSNRVQ